MNFLDLKTFPTLETERLTLREFADGDFASFFKLFSNPQVHRYFGFQPTSKKECQKWFKTFKNRFYEGKGIRWMIILKDSDEIVGNFGFHKMREEELYIERGLQLFPEFWRKGFGSEASQVATDWLRQNSHFQWIDVWTAVENIPAQALIKKQGFTAMPGVKIENGIRSLRFQFQIKSL